jgi:CRP-like cAMP-binding protein
MARRRELVEHLGQVPLFSRCTKRDLQIVARHAETIDLPEDVEVVSEGDVADAFFVILEGKAEVRRGGRRMHTLGPGAYFGELALLDPAPRSATVRSTEPVSLALLGTRMFKTILREVPPINERLLAGLAAQVRDLAAPKV